MKTPNSLEDQMRSWTPRRPSAQIEQKLFGARRSTLDVRRRHALPWYQTLGASLVGCAVVLFTVLNFAGLEATPHGSTAFSPLSNHVSSFEMASGPKNMWTAPILHWTNEGAVGSTHRSFDLLNTNRLLH
jgi:hypothetical protein